MPNSMAAVCIMRANWPSPMTATMGMPGVCAAGFPNTSSWAAVASRAAASFWAGLLQVGWVLSVTPYHFRNHGKNWPTSGWVALVHPPFPRFPQVTWSTHVLRILRSRCPQLGLARCSDALLVALGLRYDGMGAHIRPAARAQALLSVSGPRAVYGANGSKSSWPVPDAPGCGPLPPTFLLALAGCMRHPEAPPAAADL